MCRDLEVRLIMNLGLRLGLIICRDLKILLGLLLELLERKRIRNATVGPTPQNNIFREYIFIETKLLPLPPPSLKPIPIPPSRPNDLKHIAINV